METPRQLQVSAGTKTLAELKEVGPHLQKGGLTKNALNYTDLSHVISAKRILNTCGSKVGVTAGLDEPQFVMHVVYSAQTGWSIFSTDRVALSVTRCFQNNSSQR